MISLFQKTTYLSVVFLLGSLPNSILCCPPDSNLPAPSNLSGKPSFSDETRYLDAPARVFQQANDYEVLIMGGGYSPSGNQFSLESNVKYFNRIKGKLGISDQNTEIYFADGPDPARDLQYFDPNQELPLVNRALAEIFNRNKGLNHQYRSNRLVTNGTSSVKSLDSWLDRKKRNKKAGLNFIYFTGHGGKGLKNDATNTSVYLWNSQNLRMKDFAKKLDSMPFAQKTILIMVQCYSGGFAHFMFKDGNHSNGLSLSPRAGFFSTTHDRVAAGCTPDITESDYREYSTKFWAALCGETRMGQAIPKPDYDKNGKTTFAEAHAYVVINSDTIDVPVKTSEIWLRTVFSAQVELLQKDQSKENSFLDQVLGKYSWLGKLGQNQKPRKIHETIMAKAEREDLAVVRSLSLQLGFSQWPNIDEAEEKIQAFKEIRKDWEQNKTKCLASFRKLRDQIKSRIKKAYPELENPYHPNSVEVINGKQTNSFLQKLNFQGQWKRLEAEKKKLNRLEKNRFSSEKMEVKAMRLKRAIEYIYLFNYLQREGSVEQKRDFKTLTDLERFTLPIR